MWNFQGQWLRGCENAPCPTTQTRDSFPGPEPPYLVSPAAMGQESPELLIAVADHDMKSPGHLSAISSSEKPEPAPPSRLWPETSCSQRLHSLTFSWEASRAIEMPLLQAVLFSSFWACELPYNHFSPQERLEKVFIVASLDIICSWEFLLFACSWPGADKAEAT